MVLASILAAAFPALADGGKGGGSGGGLGGADDPIGVGGTGANAGFGDYGGGGGGAGTTGGSGGNGNTGLGSVGTPGSGGAGGSAAGAAGGDGGDASNNPGDKGLGGGGGGGGAHGFVGANLPGVISTGGNGGQGGRGSSTLGGGGGGGAGGYGAVVTGTGALGSLDFAVTAGNGGNGGSAGAFGGTGASGGTGLFFTNAGGVSFTINAAVNGGHGGAGVSAYNSGGSGGAGGTGLVGQNSTITVGAAGSITGGNGGAPGTALFISGSPGAGGAGIVGTGLTVINSGTIAGGLSGDGVTRANAITFTGGTNALELQAGYNLIGNVVAFSTADTLRLGGSSNASFDVSQIGVQYLGFGIFEKTGSSSWTLSGTNTAALPWSINAGTLNVTGTMANSTMTVNSGGTLAGTGTVGSVTVNGGGTFAPGSGAPTSAMSLSGNLVFQSGALYLVQVNPTTASSANVGGTASLTGGTVQAVFAPGSYMTRSYDILHATGGLVGTFSGLSGNVPAGLTPTLSYTGTDVLLNLAATLGAGTPLNQNQQNVSGAINNFFNSGGALPPGFVGIFGLTGGNLANALTLLSGEAAAGAQQGVFQLGNQFLGIVLDRFVNGRSVIGDAGGPARGFAPEREPLPEDIALAYAKITKAPLTKAPPITFEQRWTAWGGVYGGYNKTNGDPLVAGSHDLTARAGGVAAGLDYHVSRDATFGFALAGGGTKWDLAQGLGGGKSDAFQAGIYGAARSGPAYVAAALAFSNHWMSTDRFAAFGDHLTASFNAQSIGARLESGYRLGTAAFGFTPYGALQTQSFRTPTYSENDVTAGGFGLTYNARSATDTRSELGARFDHVALVNSTSVLTFRGRLGWAHDWVTDPSLTAVFQALPGASFIVNGATPAKNSALASAGAELRLANGVTLIGKFDGEFANHARTYAGTGTLRVNW